MNTPFYMLVTSLPRMPADFKIEALPISRLQLEKRLKLLTDEQLSLLYAIENLLWKSWYSPHQSVDDTKTQYQALDTKSSDFIRNISRWFLELRSILAAMRMRNAHLGQPDDPDHYWISRWQKRLNNQWEVSDFGLKKVYPWLPKINMEISENNTVAVEEFVLNKIWNYLAKIETGHYFDFDAIVIYLLRWNVINYWSGYRSSNLLDEVEQLIQRVEAELDENKRIKDQL
ncbi:V-type ATP synthase subunit A [Legionella quinlivanii]|uniref:V-type ATP synthase subunit A n=1 Tax=Legionella quinlivanii TaxID=45073 RepID=A0A0W0XL05_9GAMM|nr:DUF2764 family protein [Legionella quinlivanii]KTD45256.1 V-type ATP synthase subunit A [Legionella quinlivanii]SEG03665.1 Protein of unknown function [Legionella quinlivanii DSM 21216]STY11444.1 V-type ATP synthase subunit A [Legionella quinlivanii]